MVTSGLPGVPATSSSHEQSFSLAGRTLEEMNTAVTDTVDELHGHDADI